MLGDRFANPEFLWLLILMPALAYYLWWKRKKIFTSINYSSLKIFKNIPTTITQKLRNLPIALRFFAIVCFIIALARPQSISDKQNVSTEGIDIVMILDISGSMLAEDFNPNRIEAAKQVASEFIDGRTNDRIGLVVFSGESFTQCPLTMDYPILKNLLRDIKHGVIEDGTAIGLAMANGVNRLKDSKAKSKVIILLTDGINNKGEIDPITAARIAATYKIKVYTVGVGARGEAPYPVQTPFGIRRQMMKVDLDDKSLTQVAEMTGGKYFRATDNKKLKQIYDEIDKLEKTKMEVTAYKKYSDLFDDWIYLGLIALIIEYVLSNSFMNTKP